ncbi:MAG: hypothetical protein RDV41_09925 [Planctomycetota bacterium]|nr:hypothetical protein [Planctomycetota bacterium]
MRILRHMLLSGLVLTAATSCASYRVDEALIDDIHAKSEFLEAEAELLYLTQKVSDERLLDMIRLVPIAVEGECLCGVPGPGDVAALILDRAFGIDPECTFLARCAPRERWLIFTYACASSIVDFTPDVQHAIRARYAIRDTDGAANE